jgi:urease accessory protein
MKKQSPDRMKPLFRAALLLAPSMALAHHAMDYALPQTAWQGFASGLAHPVIGLDHAAFIAGAGFLLALVKRGLWGVAALLLGTLIGAAAHLLGLALPGGELAVALSVVLIGVLLFTHKTLSLAFCGALLLVTGTLHGHAYAEAIFGAEPGALGAYLVGFTLVQLAIAAAAYLVHRRFFLGHRTFAPAAGGFVAAVGALFAFV